MDWLLLAGLGIIWAAFLLPSSKRKASVQRQVEDFDRNMDLLADTEGRGRWIVAPRKGARFLGPRERGKARAIRRRRQIFVFLIECIGFTFLIGLVPPLRPVWWATGAFTALLFGYVSLLITINQQSPQTQVRHTVRAAAPAPPRTPAQAAAGRRFAAEGHSRTPRPVFGGLGSYDGEQIRVIVRPRGAEAAHA